MTAATTGESTTPAPIMAAGVVGAPAPRPRRGVAKRIFATVGGILSVGLLLAVLFIASLAIVIPTIAGAVPLTVLSNSMAPTMPVGSLAIVRPTMPTLTEVAQALEPAEIDEINRIDEIRPGDVIVFAPRANEEMLIIHRVLTVEVNSAGQRTFTTQGDNNSGIDDPVAGHQVRAVLWYHLPWLGYVNNSVDPDTRRTIGIVAAGIAFAWAAVHFARALRPRPRRRTTSGSLNTTTELPDASSTDASSTDVEAPQKAPLTRATRSSAPPATRD